MDLINGFRAMSVVAVSGFWVAAAAILGMFWHKFRSDYEISFYKNRE